MEGKEDVLRARLRKNRRTVAQRSRIHSVDVSALTHCCCEYDGAVALAWTDFKDTRAGKDVP